MSLSATAKREPTVAGRDEDARDDARTKHRCKRDRHGVRGRRYQRGPHGHRSRDQPNCRDEPDRRGLSRRRVTRRAATHSGHARGWHPHAVWCETPFMGVSSESKEVWWCLTTQPCGSRRSFGAARCRSAGTAVGQVSTRVDVVVEPARVLELPLRQPLPSTVLYASQRRGAMSPTGHRTFAARGKADTPRRAAQTRSLATGRRVRTRTSHPCGCRCLA